MPTPVPSASPRGASCGSTAKTSSLAVQGGQTALTTLDGLPDRHFINGPAEGAHNLGPHAIGGQRPDQSQLPIHRLRNAFLALHPQEPASEIELVPTDGALDLQLVEDDSLEGGQNLGRPTVPGFPNEGLIIPTVVTREGLVRPLHDLVRVSKESVLQEIRENFGQ